ncbi:MAG: NAD-dependent epimerase/dehydratase family protein [Gemmatimonadetes bacterium]|nr:NAD-dependent epimerase/dehydratase family protein [Gemmatimonadota bacterium]
MAASRVLITGATGFVGSHVTELLAARKVPLRALVRKTSDTRQLVRHGAELVEGGLDDAEALRSAVEGCDAVLHLAGLTHARSAAELDRTNDQGTRDLMAAAAAAKPGPGRFVYLSSLAAVGPSVNGRPVRPADEPAPLTAYGRSKLAGERACLMMAGRIGVTVARAPAVYGPGDRELLRVFRMARWGWLPMPAGPERRVQLVHVRDLAEALALAVAAEPAGIVHIADPHSWSWQQVLRLVAEAVGVQGRIIRIPQRALEWGAALSETVAGLAGRSTLVNRDKARELLAPGWLCETGTARAALGFEARVGLREGLRETATWYRDHDWLKA